MGFLDSVTQIASGGLLGTGSTSVVGADQGGNVKLNGATGSNPYDSSMGPFDPSNWMKSITDPSGFAKGVTGMGGPLPNNYDATGQLKSSEDMAQQVYAKANQQGDWISQNQSPGMGVNINAQTITAPKDINAQTIATPQAVTAQNIQAPDAITAQQVAAPNAINAQQLSAAPTIAGPQADALRQQQLDQAAAAANSPSAAAAQMRAAGGQISQQQMGQAAMARGVDRLSAKRDAMLATGTQGMQAANQTSALAATEQAAKQQAYSQALAGVRTGDVNVGQAQTQVGALNQAANLQAQTTQNQQTLQQQQANQQAGIQAAQYTAGNALTAAQANQNAGLQAQTTTNAQALTAAQANQGTNLQAQQYTAGNQLTAGQANQSANLNAQNAQAIARQQGWNAQTQAQDKANQTALQAVGAQNQAQGTAATYGSEQNKAAVQQQGGIISAAGSVIGGIISDERAKTDMNEVGGSSFADSYSRQLAGAYGGGVSPGSPYNANQDFLAWKPPVQQPDQPASKGLLSDERTKRDVDAMSPHQIANWAETVPGFTFRYKPGVEGAPDDGERFHAGTGAQSLEDTGPLGKMFVKERPDGLKEVDMAPLAFFHSKGALARADEAHELAAKAYALASRGSKRKEAR